MTAAADAVTRLGGEDLVLDALARTARSMPDRVYLYDGEEDRAVTYGEFVALTNALARNLIALGLARGDRVAVFTRNAWVSTLVMFSVWKAGGVYSPVNFAFRGRLLRHQLTDVRPAFLVAERALLDPLNEVAGDLPDVPRLILHDPEPGAHDYDAGAASVRPDPAWGAPVRLADIQAGRGEDLDRTPEWSDVASIFYTSGTTGPSKGVVQTFRWMNQYTYGMRLLTTAEDVIYNDLPLYHVGGAIENVARAVWTGSTVALWDRFSAGGFWERVRRAEASQAILLDVMIPWLMAAPESASDRANTLNKVYMQPLPQYHRRVAERFGFDIVLAGYGQTESGNVFLGVIDETEGEEARGTPPSLYRGLSREAVLAVARDHGMAVMPGSAVLAKGFMGRPSPLVEVAVVDERDEAVPVGAVGELVVRPRLAGTLLAEYFGRPDATVRAFRNLWFHTGDAVRCDPDGYYYFVDRLGDRIRHRGETFSSFQVEDVFNAHPAVAVSAAFGVPSAEGEEDDVAVFVVPREGAAVDVDELRAYAERELPRAMRPAVIRVVGELPRTPTNKVEKYRLKAELLRERGEPSAGTRGPAGPQGEAEER